MRFAMTVGVWALALGSTAQAATITLSTVSSDATPAAQLDAILALAVGDFDLINPGDELELTLTNPAFPTGDALFSVNEVYWNALSHITGLTLLSATHSVAGDVFADWNPVDPNQMVNGFGQFDFGLSDGLGEMSPAIAMPGESVVFVMAISGTGPFVDSDFVVDNASGFRAAAKFINGPDDPEDPGNEDSAFGSIPEPGSLLLLGAGLAGLAFVRRRIA